MALSSCYGEKNYYKNWRELLDYFAKCNDYFIKEGSRYKRKEEYQNKVFIGGITQADYDLCFTKKDYVALSPKLGKEARDLETHTLTSEQVDFYLERQKYWNEGNESGMIRVDLKGDKYRWTKWNFEGGSYYWQIIIGHVDCDYW